MGVRRWWALGGGLCVLGIGAAHAEEASRGRIVYVTRCAPCHGPQGAGDGPAAAAITPKPRNFREPEFWNGRTRAQLLVVVRDGRPGTMMAPFAGVLSDADIEGVVDYLEAFRPRGP
jgi:high-affinity iron transporter